ncbi:uncharacterized protein LOC144650268 [Oculina patagonica]
MRWLGTLNERIGEALHPELPGKWCKIQYAVQDADILKHFLFKLSTGGGTVQNPHAVVISPHRRLPCKRRAKCISFRMYDLEPPKKVLAEKPVQLTSESFLKG